MENKKEKVEELQQIYGELDEENKEKMVLVVEEYLNIQNKEIRDNGNINVVTKR